LEEGHGGDRGGGGGGGGEKLGEGLKRADSDEGNCYVCLEPCTTCSTCVCHISVHSECMARMPNKTQCSVCRTEFGSMHSGCGVLNG
jgi:hypothetical protein